MHLIQQSHVLKSDDSHQRRPRIQALPPPQDTIEPDLWEGENMEKLGSFFEKFFLPVLVVLGLVIGGVAAGTYNDGADVFQVCITSELIRTIRFDPEYVSSRHPPHQTASLLSSPRIKYYSSKEIL